MGRRDSKRWLQRLLLLLLLLVLLQIHEPSLPFALLLRCLTPWTTAYHGSRFDNKVVKGTVQIRLAWMVWRVTTRGLSTNPQR